MTSSFPNRPLANRATATKLEGVAHLPNDRSCPLTITIDDSKGEWESLGIAANVYERFIKLEKSLLQKLIANEIPTDHWQTVQEMLDEDGVDEKVNEEWLLNNYSPILGMAIWVDEGLIRVTFEEVTGYVGWDISLEIEYSTIL